LIFVLARRARAFFRWLHPRPPPQWLIALLEGIRSANHLLIERLIKAPFHPGDIREDVLARLGLLDRNNPGPDAAFAKRP